MANLIIGSPLSGRLSMLAEQEGRSVEDTLTAALDRYQSQTMSIASNDMELSSAAVKPRSLDLGI